MQKILIIRFSSIGDIVLTTPVIRCVKQQIAGAEVHVLTKGVFANIFENNPYVDKVISINQNVSEAIPQLQKENYDFVIDLHHNLRTLSIKRALKKPTQAFNKLNIQKWLRVYFKVDKLPDVHIVDRYMAAAAELNVANDNKGLDYFIPKQDEVNLNTLPQPFRNSYIAFVIGAAHATKRLPPDKIISICNQLNKPIILLGGKEDVRVATRIEATSKANVYNACGIYNLNQSASLVKQANLVITHDTGLMHIATAFQKPIISIWGNTIPAFGMYPYYRPENKKQPFKIIEVNHLSCRPCSKIGFDKCPKKHFKCMNDIDEAAVLLAAEKLYPF